MNPFKWMPSGKSTLTRRDRFGSTGAGDESELNSPYMPHSNVHPPMELESEYRGGYFDSGGIRELESAYDMPRNRHDEPNAPSPPPDHSQPVFGYRNFAQPSQTPIIHTAEPEVPKKNFSFIEVWPKRDGRLQDVTSGELSEPEIAAWLVKPKDIDASTANTSTVKAGGLRLLCGSCHSSYGRYDSVIPFNTQNRKLVTDTFHIPASFFQMIKEESTRSCKTTIFNDSGKVAGFSFCVKFFSWWLGTGSLAIYYDNTSREVHALLLGLDGSKKRKAFVDLIKAKTSLALHPMFLVLIFCEVLAEVQDRKLRVATTRILTLEATIGVNDYAEIARREKKPVEEPLDFEYVNRSLNGELSRLANYEKWVKSLVSLLDGLLKGKELEVGEEMAYDDPMAARLAVNIREYAEYLLGWNVDLLARTVCQQKIVNGQIQTTYNLLAQRDNKLNITIAQASKNDSTAMRTIAIVTMVFLPGAYIATLFSMTMFNWQATGDQPVLSGKFWVYWVVTVPVTVMVLAIWALWSQPWRGGTLVPP